MMIVALRTDRNFVIHSHVSAKCKDTVVEAGCFLEKSWGVKICLGSKKE